MAEFHETQLSPESAAYITREIDIGLEPELGDTRPQVMASLRDEDPENLPDYVKRVLEDAAKAITLRREELGLYLGFIGLFRKSYDGRQELVATADYQHVEAGEGGGWAELEIMALADESRDDWRYGLRRLCQAVEARVRRGDTPNLYATVPKDIKYELQELGYLATAPSPGMDPEELLMYKNLSDTQPENS